MAIERTENNDEKKSTTTKSTKTKDQKKKNAHVKHIFGFFATYKTEQSTNEKIPTTPKNAANKNVWRKIKKPKKTIDVRYIILFCGYTLTSNYRRAHKARTKPGKKNYAPLFRCAHIRFTFTHKHSLARWADTHVKHIWRDCKRKINKFISRRDNVRINLKRHLSREHRDCSNAFFFLFLIFHFIFIAAALFSSVLQTDPRRGCRPTETDNFVNTQMYRKISGIVRVTSIISRVTHAQYSNIIHFWKLQAASCTGPSNAAFGRQH